MTIEASNMIGPPHRMARMSEGKSLAVTGTIGTCDPIDFSTAAGGGIFVPNGSSLTSLTLYGSADGATFYPLQDATGAAIVVTVAANKGYPLPTDVYGAIYLKFLGNTTGTIVVSLKG